MDRVTLTITSELFDDNTHQEVSLRKNITIRTLIEETRREFSLVDANYTLRLKDKKEPLGMDQTIDQLGLQTGGELIFDREQRRRLSQQFVMRGGQAFNTIINPAQAMLREETSGQVFENKCQPAIIGRQDAKNPASAGALAVDLSAQPEARTVSRQHAQITEVNGQYFLESIEARNPTLLNDRVLQFGERRPILVGDKVQVGKIVLLFSIQRK
ncbi:MAG: FHA domain-containing protein [Chloroflexi bacterium]|nr:FHA domain-containing protein [Chloroflexota bacterium]